MTDRTTPLGLFHYAHSYAASASALRGVTVKASHADAPIRFLYSHAIELYLKSFLRLHGLTLEDLKDRKKFGHDISALVTRAETFGLTFDDVQRQQIEAADDAIHDRYLTAGTRTVLIDDRFHSLCVHLHEQIGKQVYAASGIARALPPL